MEQKNYIYEIVNLLLKKKSHAREIARILKINHMLINRKLKELYNLNVVDFDDEGKNKIYSLKNSVEAKSYVFITEKYKLSILIKKYPKLRGIIEKIQSDKRIKLAILFGSYAKDNVKKDSDIDIYIETIDRKIKKEIELLDSKLSIKIGKYDENNLLIKEIAQEHVILKGVELYYEKNKFFEETH